MEDLGRRRLSTRQALAVLVLLAVALAGCGGSSQDAAKVLRQTFSGSHKVNSGQLTFAVSIQPSGSGLLRTPVSLSFSGPFQSLGAGKLPQSDFNLGLSAAGHTVAVGILSTGTSGYVSFQGSNYLLPQADYQKLESSFASVASSTGGHGSSLLGKLGIQPLTWLRDPQVVGNETVGGASTTHIRAGINISALLGDFNVFLARASSLGVSGAARFPHALSPTTINTISGEIQNPSVDVWTGTSDKTLRKLVIRLNAPIPGQLSSLLGRTAGLSLTLQYANLNQPQTITAPTSTAPFSQFETQLRTFVSGLLGGASAGGLLGGAGTSSGSGSTGSSGATLNAYSQCVQAAGTDVTKLQQCASLLNQK